MDRSELQMEVDAGLSIAQLANRFACSKGSVRHWLAKYGMKTRNRSRRSSRPEAIAAREAGLKTFRARCPKHGETVFLVRSDGGSRCRSCRSEMVVKRRRRVKEILVREAGGSCALCGYHRHLGGLAFHHVDPATKMIGIAYKGRALSIKTLRAEAEKCVLLCHNCHSEVEAGLLVNGHRLLPAGGHLIPHWWPCFLPAGGHQISPLVAIISPQQGLSCCLR